MAEPIIRKDGTNHPLYKMPSTYESERVTYGNSNVKDELDAINSNKVSNVYTGSYGNAGTLYEIAPGYDSQGPCLVFICKDRDGVEYKLRVAATYWPT